MEENENRLHLLIASNFVIRPQILIFSLFKIGSLSPYCQRCVTTVDRSDSRRFSTQPRRHHRQPSLAVYSWWCSASPKAALLLSVAVATVSYGNFVQWRGLSPDAAKTLVQTFISSRLHYCNALLFGVSEGLMRRLQSVQNAAARLVTRDVKKHVFCSWNISWNISVFLQFLLKFFKHFHIAHIYTHRHTA